VKKTEMRSKSDGSRRARILIASVNEDSARGLRSVLESHRHTVVGITEDGEELRHLIGELKPDLAIVESGLSRSVDYLDGRFDTPFILLDSSSPEAQELPGSVPSGVFGILTPPVKDEDLLNMVAVAIARWDEMRQLREAIEELQDALETRKVVERAKGILMEQLGLSENEAYVKLRTQSQQESKSMRQIAEAVITAHQLASTNS